MQSDGRQEVRGQARRPFPSWSIGLGVVAAGLAVLVAVGSTRSIARVSGSHFLDIRPALGDLFVLLAGVLAVEVILLAYLVYSSMERHSGRRLRIDSGRSTFWSRLVASLVPLLAVAVLIAIAARKGQEGSTTSLSLGPLAPLLPPDGGATTGQPLVVHWWVLGGVALGVGAVLLSLVLLRRRRQKAAGKTGPDATDEREELRLVVEDSLQGMDDDPDPRRAVIAAYATMEHVLSERGLPRRPSETPLEYLARWTGALHVGRAAAEALAVLYERARFSMHLVDEEMRRDAKEAFGAFRRELGEGEG